MATKLSLIFAELEREFAAQVAKLARERAELGKLKSNGNTAGAADVPQMQGNESLKRPVEELSPQALVPSQRHQHKKFMNRQFLPPSRVEKQQDSATSATDGVHADLVADSDAVVVPTHSPAAAVDAANLIQAIKLEIHKKLRFNDTDADDEVHLSLDDLFVDIRKMLATVADDAKELFTDAVTELLQERVITVDESSNLVILNKQTSKQ